MSWHVKAKTVEVWTRKVPSAPSVPTDTSTFVLREDDSNVLREDGFNVQRE